MYVENVGDFNEPLPVGTKFEIRNLTLNPGYEFQNVSSRTSWNDYGIAVGALSGTIQEVASGPNEILISLATAPIDGYLLDVNFSLDGELLYLQGIADIKEAGIGSFDVYVNDELYAENVGDFNEPLPVGTNFEIRNLSLNPGYEFQNVSSRTSWNDYGIAVGALSGTIQEVAVGPNEILVSLITVPIIPDPEVTFSIEAGANVVNQTLELYAPEGCEIYYTTDGSDPVVSPEKLYSDPLALSANVSRFAADSNLINIGNYRIYDDASLPQAVTVKAIAVTPNGVSSPIETRTYFFQERESVAVISISTDYDNLLDYDTGIMVKGAYYDAWAETPEAADIIANRQYYNYEGNYTQKGKDWERPATIEIFDGENYVVENCGIRLRGGTSRMYAQKPFNIYFRKDYGAKKLDYALFEDAVSIDGNVLSSYKDFMLRNGGNDTEYLKFHDALIQSLVKDLDFTTQAGRPAVLYLNGEYMGVYVMQEKFSDQLFADHYLVDKDNVVVIEEGVVDEGEDADIVLYEELQSFADMDMTDPEVYAAFCNVVDIESMIDYYATEIYIANADWNTDDEGVVKNIRLWRVRMPENDSFGDGKWRWILYDTEYSASLYNLAKTSYNYDSFAAALNADPLFASVMKNAVFCQAFKEKIESLAVNNFSSANVNSALASFSETYQPYMSDYYKRFGDTSSAWNSNINGIRNFFAKRAEYILDVVENYQSPQVAKFPLDVNFTLDSELLYNQGITDIKDAEIGSFDVYINDELYAENVGDFNENFVVGTKFEIRNLRLNSGYAFENVSSKTSWNDYGIAVGGLSGTIQEVASGPNEILISLVTAPIDPEVTFSIEAGSNVENQTLELYAPEGCEIYYTTDGSDPVVSPENLYSEPLSLSANASRLAAESNNINIGNFRIYDNSELPKAVTVKAVAVTSDGAASPIATRTYFFQTREPIAVISISTDYDNLLDYDTGIMVKGAYYDAWIQTPEAADIIANGKIWKYQGNYTQKGKDWERPATIEIFDGENYVVENCGIRLRGDASRMYSQKSFAFYFTEDYGVNGLDYAIFDDATTVDGDVLSSYKDFIVRNGGNDTMYLKFHDALIQSLAKDLNIATQASRPAVLYLNGEYMGVYVAQERYDARFFADHYLVDKDDVVVAQEGAVAGGGDADVALYEELLSYADMDMTDPEVYNAFHNVVDIESMIDYYATEIYIANADWKPTKNVCLWRTRTSENDSFGDGKWRWALYDTEFSSSLYDREETSYSHDSFTAALNADPLFASVMKNADFYRAFKGKIESLAANNFSSANVDSALASFSDAYRPYMSNYYKRFGDTSWAWNSNMDGIRNFFANRAGYILSFVENYQQ